MSTASLPMYDFPDARGATDAWWAGLARHLRRAGISDVPAGLVRRDDLIEQWSDPALLVSQTCGFILRHILHDAAQPIATPHYSATGCAGPHYSSVIITRADHPARRLTDFRGGIAVYSRSYSHAGYNSFRGLMAPVAAGTRFFSQVISAGSHADSLKRVATGAADLATIDCVIHAFMARFRPGALHGTRIFGFTPTAPAPPYIAPRSASADTVVRLRTALADAAADPTLAAARSALFLDGFSFDDAPDYARITAVASDAVRLGYPELR